VRRDVESCWLVPHTVSGDLKHFALVLLNLGLIDRLVPYGFACLRDTRTFGRRKFKCLYNRRGCMSPFQIFLEYTSHHLRLRSEIVP